MTIERRRELVAYVAGWMAGLRQDEVTNKEMHLLFLSDIIEVLAGPPSEYSSCVGKEHMSDYPVGFPVGFGLKQPPGER